MRIIRLVDGKVYQVDRCGADLTMLSVNITSQENLLSMVEEFSKPENLTVIEHRYEDTETDHVFFEGYTRLAGLYITPTGVNMLLNKG